MKRKLISVLLAAVLVITLLPQPALGADAPELSGKCGENLNWTFDEATGTLRITGSGPMDDLETFIDYQWVVRNPWEAFTERITAVDLPEGLTSIGRSCFAECTGLKRIRIPEGVTAIGDQAFYGCSALADISLPDSVQSIGGSAFLDTAFFNDGSSWTGDLLYLGKWLLGYTERDHNSIAIRPGTEYIADYTFAGDTNVSDVTLPEGLKSIGNFAFNGCFWLKQIQFPASLTRIGKSAFGNCLRLTSVTIPAGVTYIGNSAFGICDKLTQINVAPENQSYQSIDGVLFSKDGKTLVQFPSGREGACRIPAGVTVIGDNAFDGCTYLKSIVIPDSVTAIGDLAFTNCGQLTSLSIPGSVTSFGDSLFSSCYQLLSVDFPKTLTSISDGMFYNCASMPSFIVPDSVVSIGREAFGWCLSLSWILIPESVTSIDPTAFERCENLRAIFGFADSAAQTFAKEHGYIFVPLGPGVFVDVYAGAYYEEAVRWAAEQGVTNGIAPYVFRPDSTCTRAQAITLLWRASESPEPKSALHPFKDVKADAYYTKAVTWAAEEKITNGTAAEAFSPDSGCTRGQFVTLLWRAAGEPEPSGTESPFTDVKADAYYYKAVQWAVEQGITKGTSADKFSPESTCTRGQIVTFLYRDLA